MLRLFSLVILDFECVFVYICWFSIGIISINVDFRMLVFPVYFVGGSPFVLFFVVGKS